MALKMILSSMILEGVCAVCFAQGFNHEEAYNMIVKVSEVLTDQRKVEG